MVDNTQNNNNIPDNLEIFNKILHKLKLLFPNYEIEFEFSKSYKRAKLLLNKEVIYSIEVELLLKEFSFFSDRENYIDIISSIFEEKIISTINKKKKTQTTKRNYYIYFNKSNYKFFPKPLNITVDQLKDALYEGKSLLAASKILKISYPSIFKYVKKFKVIDEETGREISLYEKFKKDCSTKHINLKSYSDLTLEQAMEGNYPESIKNQPHKIKEKLIKSGLIKEECSVCGFSEKRITDGRSPLILHFKDFDKTNLKLNNLELLCYNCYYLTVGNVFWYKPVYIKADKK